MSGEAHKAIVRRWVEDAWNGGRLEVTEEIYAPDYVLHDYAGPVNGPAGLAGFVAVFRSAFPDLRVTIDDMVAEGDRVAWRATMTGTHRGEFLGIPPSGRTWSATATITSRFEGGKWAEDWVDYDRLGLLQQIGALSAPAAA